MPPERGHVYAVFMSDDSVRLFITMNSRPDMSLFDWDRQVEELLAAVSALVPLRSWSGLRVYGPHNDRFGLPGVTVELAAPISDLEGWIKDVESQKTWIDLPVNVYLVTKAVR
jgi:hypothetical protein